MTPNDDNGEDNNILNLIQLAIATFATWPHCLLSLFDRRALTLSRRAHWVKLTHSHSRADSHINIIVIITRHCNRHINHDWWRHHFSITNIHLSWSVQCILYMNSVYYTQYNTNTNIHSYSTACNEKQFRSWHSVRSRPYLPLPPLSLPCCSLSWLDWQLAWRWSWWWCGGHDHGEVYNTVDVCNENATDDAYYDDDDDDDYNVISAG